MGEACLLNAQRYSLQVLNLNNQCSANGKTKRKTAVQLPLLKGVPYSWSVVSENTMVNRNGTK